MAVLREIVARYGLKFDDKAFKKADTTISNTIGKLKVMGGILVGGVVARGVFGFIDGIRVLGDNVDKTAIAIGVNRQALQEWEFVAGLAGVQGSELALSLRRLQKGAVDAATGLETYKREFDRLGISVKDNEGKLKSADVLLTEMADGINRLETETEKVAVAQTLLGRQGPKMLALFKNGSKGIEEFRKEARDLGGVLSDDLVNSAVDLTDDIWRFDFAMRGIKSTVGLFIFPMFNKLVKFSTKVSKGFRKLQKETNVVEAAFIVLGTIAVIAMRKILISAAAAFVPFLKVALVIGLVILVVDELITTFQGGDTLLRDFIDTMFGVGATQTMIESLTAAWNWLGDSIAEAWDGLKLFIDDVVSNTQLAVDAFKTGWTEAFQVFTGWIDKAGKMWDVFVLAMWQKIPEPLKKFLGFAGKGIDATVNFVATGAKAVLDRIEESGQGPSIEETAADLNRKRAFSGPKQTRADVEKDIAEQETERGRRASRDRVNRARVNVNIPTTRATTAGASINQNNNFNMSVSTGGKTGVNDIVKAGNRMSKTAAKQQKRATLEAVKQRVGT